MHQYTYLPDTGLLDTFKISSATPLIELQYQYDASYNIRRIEDNVISGLSIQFDYDALNRLKSAVLDSGVTRTYKFDRDGQSDSKGNLELKANRRMTYPDGKTYPTSDEMYNPDTAGWQANQTFTWSANGNLLTKGPFSFSYDSNSMMTRATEVDPQNGATVVGDTKFFYDHTGQRFLKTHLRNGVLIKTWYLGDSIEIREKYIGASTGSSGSFDAYQATKYIYGTDDKKLASITGNVKSTMPVAGAGAMFALADHYSSSSIAGLANKAYFGLYGIYQHEDTGKALRISTLSLLALLLVAYLISTQRKERTYPLWTRFAAVTILVSFFSVNCGTGNAPGSVPTDLSQSKNSIISALCTGLPTGTVYYSHNHLGSGALVTDSAGNEVFRITYTEYGEIDLANSGKYNPATGEIEHHLSDALIAITAVKYTGQEYDPETGFYYYNARYYDPQLGVFTTPDTEFDEGAGNFAFNRHMYVGGNPIMYSDPSGHFIVALFVGLGALAGTILGGTNGNVKGWLNGTQKWNWAGAIGGAIAGGIAGYGIGVGIKAGIGALAAAGAGGGGAATSGGGVATAGGGTSAASTGTYPCIWGMCGEAIANIAQAAPAAINPATGTPAIQGAITIGETISVGGAAFGSGSLMGGGVGTLAAGTAVGFGFGATMAALVPGVEDNKPFIMRDQQGKIDAWPSRQNYCAQNEQDTDNGCAPAGVYDAEIFDPLAFISAPYAAYNVSANQLSRLGWALKLSRYKHGGFGVNVYKDGARKFAVDVHKFKLDGATKTRLHYHRGPTKSQMRKHRPYEGGW